MTGPGLELRSVLGEFEPALIHADDDGDDGDDDDDMLSRFWSLPQQGITHDPW